MSNGRGKPSFRKPGSNSRPSGSVKLLTAEGSESGDTPDVGDLLDLLLSDSEDEQNMQEKVCVPLCI